MTLMKVGFALLAAGAALIRRSGDERRAIRDALSRRLRGGIALAVAGLGLVAAGARIQGQIVFRRWKRTHRAEIDELRRGFARLRPVFAPLLDRARGR